MKLSKALKYILIVFMFPYYTDFQILIEEETARKVPVMVLATITPFCNNEPPFVANAPLETFNVKSTAGVAGGGPAEGRRANASHDPRVARRAYLS